MDGSTASLIAIPIVVTLSLAAWLILVAYAASHPQWKRGHQAPANPRPVVLADADRPGARSPEPAKTAATSPTRDLRPAA